MCPRGLSGLNICDNAFSVETNMCRLLFQQPDKLSDIILLAILMDRVDFVELLMDQGVVPKQFLTKERHVALYNFVSQYQVKKKYREIFETHKSGNKTSLGEIGLKIRTHASPYLTVNTSI